MSGEWLGAGGIALACTLIAGRVFLVRTRLEFRARICEVLAATARRGLPLLPALEAARTDYGGARGRALSRTCAALEQGMPLHEACGRAGRGYFPHESLLALAEGGGSFPAALQAAAIDSERALDMRHRGLLALAYPVVLIAVLPLLLAVTVRLPVIVDGFGVSGGLPGRWLEVSRLVTQVVLGVVVGSAVGWLLLGARLPYPGRALFRAERALRASATRLRAGGDWSELPRRLPADLAARLTIAMRYGPERASEAIDAVAQDCARRATEVARRAMSIGQMVLLLSIGLVAALQFGTIFMIQRACLEGIAPW